MSDSAVSALRWNPSLGSHVTSSCDMPTIGMPAMELPAPAEGALPAWDWSAAFSKTSALAMMAAVPKWCATVSKAPATRPATAATTTILPKTVMGRENQ